MIDEVCMWILDPHTVVTGFPERYGQGLRFGQTSIHTRIREKISRPSECKVRTVFDLAIAILEECCQAFFAPADATGDCPGGLIDIFTEAVYGQVRLFPDWNCLPRLLVSVPHCPLFQSFPYPFHSSPKFR